MKHTLYFSASAYDKNVIEISTFKQEWDPTFLTMEIDLPYVVPSDEDWKKICYAHNLDKAKKAVADCSVNLDKAKDYLAKLTCLEHIE